VSRITAAAASAAAVAAARSAAGTAAAAAAGDGGAAVASRVGRGGRVSSGIDTIGYLSAGKATQATGQLWVQYESDWYEKSKQNEQNKQNK
jgi:hypothetical protein